jgi:hypothetical protein
MFLEIGRAETYIFPLLGANLSLMIGGLAYGCKYCDRNGLFGVRTAYSMRDDEKIAVTIAAGSFTRS